MYDFRKAVSFLALFCSICVFFLISRSMGATTTLIEEERDFLVAHKGRLWWVGRSGRLLEVASVEDALSRAYVSGVEVRDGCVQESVVNLIQKLKPLLSNPYVVEVVPKERRVVLLKSVSLRFNEWEDLLRNLSTLNEAIKRMEPKGEYFLSSNGLFYKLRGGDDEER